MNAVRQLRRAGLTAFIASLLAVNCGEQEFNLLPLEQEDPRGGPNSAGDGGRGVPPAEKGGAANGGRSSTGGKGATGGAAVNGGRGGMSSGRPDCDPPVCCISDEDCFDDRRPFCLAGGVCQECYLDRNQGYKTIGCAQNEVCGGSYRCVPSCENQDCPGDLKCAPNSQCVECVEHVDCSQNEYEKLCWLYNCVACRSNADCPAFTTCNQFNICV